MIYNVRAKFRFKKSKKKHYITHYIRWNEKGPKYFKQTLYEGKGKVGLQNTCRKTKEEVRSHLGLNSLASARAVSKDKDRWRECIWPIYGSGHQEVR